MITVKARKKIAELILISQEAMPDYKLFLRITAILDDSSKLKHQTYFDYENMEYVQARNRSQSNKIRFRT